MQQKEELKKEIEQKTEQNNDLARQQAELQEKSNRLEIDL